MMHSTTLENASEHCAFGWNAVAAPHCQAKRGGGQGTLPRLRFGLRSGGPRFRVGIRSAWRAFTLVELLVVISIIGMLLALLFPAVNAAREAGRSMTCKSNLREFGVGMLQRSDKFGTFCSGAFDWTNDGAVTEVGWVADLVNSGIPTGKMLCPSSPAQISATYNDLLAANTAAFDSCVNRMGSAGQVLPSGCTAFNPCYQICNGMGGTGGQIAPGSAARIQLVRDMIYSKWYNTNYTASWWLVRSGVRLDGNGNLSNSTSGCPCALAAVGATLGPLTRARADSSGVVLSFLPLLGCGGGTVPLVQGIGSLPMSSPAVASMTAGPVQNPSMMAPSFSAGTPQTGPNGWWAGWQATLQDFRAFGTVHRNSCNLLMADGGVQSYFDTSGDHLLNNGFTSSPQNGFSSNTVEMSPNEVYSSWSLQP
jgi:prepilin-type N-terminal cleavage/methylation domain-containing protein/prepilin-type processing-associated H-X9-DG protein